MALATKINEENNNKPLSLDYSLDSFSQFQSSDYPVNIYYIDFSQMFMGSSRHHWHSDIEIDLIRQGSANFNIGEESITVSEGNAIIINGDRIHSITPTNKENCIIISILFSADFIFGNNDSIFTSKYRDPITLNDCYPFTILLRNNPSHKAGLECINQILNDNMHKSYGYELMTKSNLCKLWIWLLNMKNKDSGNAKQTSIIDENRVKQGILYIHEHYNENITLDTIAENIHLSKSECCRCFKRAASLTPFEYIMKHRIYISARKMQRGEEIANSINELAINVGFNNASYFNKIFKNYIGTTPTKYKETIKLSHRDALNPYGIPMTKN